MTDDSKKLETVEEHNDRIRKERADMELALQLTGVACPKCGKELEWQNQWPGGSWTWPEPKTRAAGCKDCRLSVELAR